MRHITEDGLALIKRFEGFSAKPYICPAGHLTIGYGHVVRDGIQSVTMEQAEELLAMDVGTAERSVLRLIAVPLADGQFNALVSFTFNLGGGALQRSTLRRKINRGDDRYG
jgi:lysozyme